MNTPKGLFITFEGGDGCGKTTQLNLVEKYLSEKGQNIIRMQMKKRVLIFQNQSQSMVKATQLMQTPLQEYFS